MLIYCYACYLLKLVQHININYTVIIRMDYDFMNSGVINNNFNYFLSSKGHHVFYRIGKQY